MEEEEVQDRSLQSGVGAEDLIESLHMEASSSVHAHTHTHTSDRQKITCTYTTPHVLPNTHTSTYVHVCVPHRALV